MEKHEFHRQEYSNDRYISAGILDGHEHDTIYVEFGDEEGIEWELYLRPDEAASIVWMLGGCLYSETMRLQEENGVFE